MAMLTSTKQICIPVVVPGELYGGYTNRSQTAKRIAILQEFIADPAVKLLDITAEVSKVYGELYAYLRKRGTPIPTNDIWIAAVAIHTGQPLLTLDSDFDRLPQVSRVYL